MVGQALATTLPKLGKRTVRRAPLPTTLHVERHFSGTEKVRDIVIGMSDGLTVPFRWRRAYPDLCLLPVLLSLQGSRRSRRGRSLWGSVGICSVDLEDKAFYW
jgi:hypothetical protein